MSGTVPRWLKIVGVGFVVIVLVEIAVIAGGVFFIRDAVRGFERADRSLEQVAERHGEISDYRPEPTGAIEPERIEAFLAVREAIAEPRSESERSLAVFAAGSPPGAMRKVSAGIGMLRQLPEFLEQRNEALMEAGMGFGEYYYIYSLAYYSWLGMSPADGPAFKLVGDNGYVLENMENFDDPRAGREREAQARRSLNRLLFPTLLNQLSDLAEQGRDADRAEWRGALLEEIEAMTENGDRVPWEDGLPEAIEASLRPYRDRFESTYSPMCNALEIGVARR